MADIGRTTLYRWMNDHRFRTSLERLRAEAGELANTELRGLMLKGTLVLAEAMEDPSPHVRKLDRQSDAVAHALVNDCGIRRGDRVSMFLGNCPELIVFYLAGLKTGAIVVPINVLYRDRELTRLLTDAEPRVLLCDPQRFEVLAPLRHRFDALEQIFVTGAETPAAMTRISGRAPSA